MVYACVLYASERVVSFLMLEGDSMLWLSIKEKETMKKYYKKNFFFNFISENEGKME